MARRTLAARAAAKQFLDKDGLVHLIAKNDERYVRKEDGKGLSSNDFSDEYKKIVDDLNYKPITINSFTNNKSTLEMGATLTEINLTWSFNKTPKSAKLDAEALDVSATSKALTGLNITSNKTWTLSATDERDKTVTKTTAVTFLNGVYWGVAAAASEFTSDFILKLTKALQGSRAKTFTVNAAAGQHIYYAAPTRYGACGFNVGGFDGGFSKVGTIQFTNASGYTESYDIYMSDNAGLGSTTVKVS